MTKKIAEEKNKMIFKRKTLTGSPVKDNEANLTSQKPAPGMATNVNEKLEEKFERD